MRRQLRRGMRRPGLAVVRVVERAHRRRDPDASLLVQHRVVHVVLALPDRLAAPVRRRMRHRRRCRRCVGIAHCQFDGTRHVLHRVEHRQVVGAQLERAVERAVGIDRRVAAIGRDDVVQIDFRVRPVPHRHDDVALGALRARRRRRKLAGVDAVGPIGELFQHAVLAELVQRAAHLRAGLARLHAAIPRGDGRRELAQLPRNLARRFVAELMARQAAARLQASQPIRLAAHVRVDAVAGIAGGGELGLVGNFDQREPVARREILRGGPGVRRNRSPSD